MLYWNSWIFNARGSDGVQTMTEKQIIKPLPLKHFGTFYRELEEVINRHGLDNILSRTDYVIAEFLVDCLRALYSKEEDDRRVKEK